VRQFGADDDIQLACLAAGAVEQLADARLRGGVIGEVEPRSLTAVSNAVVASVMCTGLSP
jgi:hypothetical protein